MPINTVWFIKMTGYGKNGKIWAIRQIHTNDREDTVTFILSNSRLLNHYYIVPNWYLE